MPRIVTITIALFIFNGYSYCYNKFILLVGDRSMPLFIPNSPMHVNWNITYSCSFNCNHCYSRTRQQIELCLLDKIRVANNIIKNEIFVVNLGGGEPLLSPDVFEIISLLSCNNVFVNLSTNGWNITDEIINSLVSSGLGGISISIDHIEADKHDANRNHHGSFLCALEAINKFVNAKIPITLSTTITKANFDVLESIISLATNVGCKGVDFKRLKTTGNARDMQGASLNAKQEHELFESIPLWKSKFPIGINLTYGTTRIPDIDAGCPCGKTSIGIMPDGGIAPCVYSDLVIGNATTDDIGELWRNSKYFDQLRKNNSCMGLMG